MLCGRLNLDRTDRHDLALILVGHEGTWSTLSEADAERLCLVLVGVPYVLHLLNERLAIERATWAARQVTPLPPVARRRVSA